MSEEGGEIMDESLSEIKVEYTNNSNAIFKELGISAILRLFPIYVSCESASQIHVLIYVNHKKSPNLT
jgi:hypothetical protein